MPKYSRKRNYSRKKGGRFLGKGTYGCTFIPSLLCKNESVPREGISKILINKDDVSKEIEISQKILEIDPERKYFLSSTGNCIHDPKSLNMSTKNGVSCNKYQGYGNTSDRYLIFYPMGGQNIDSIILPSDKYSVFIKSLRNLFEGLVVLHRADMFHADIKGDNILSLYENGNYMNKFIDFGLTSVIRVNGISTLYLLANHEIVNHHPYYPLDIILMTESSRRGLNQYFLDNWNYKTMNYNLYVPQSVYWDSNWNLKISPSSIMQQYNNNRVFYDNMYKSMKSIDIAAFGILLSNLYSRLTGHYSRIDTTTNRDTIAINIPAYKGKIKINDLKVEHFNGDRDIFSWHLSIASNFSLKFFDLIVKMLDINGATRLTAEEALAYFDSIISGVDGIFYDIFDESILKKSLNYINIEVSNPEIVGFPKKFLHPPPFPPSLLPRRPNGQKPPLPPRRPNGQKPPPPPRHQNDPFAPLPPPPRSLNEARPPSANLVPPPRHPPASHFPGSQPFRNLTGVSLGKTKKNNRSVNNAANTATAELKKFKYGLGL
jgi:hypothetical protein